MRAAATARLEARITADQKELLKEAADLRGVSLSDFVVSCAYDVAIRVVQENRVIELSRRDQTSFVAALLSDSEPNPRLQAAAARHGYVSRPANA
jgi:uncharacterized protein (DUF1778 family)